MPNPKTGTVTPNVAQAIKEIKAGKVEFRVDKTGIIHAPVGKTSFSTENLVANTHALVDSVVKAKPPAAKGRYLKISHRVLDDGARVSRSTPPTSMSAAEARTKGSTMAVTRAEKEQELQDLSAAFKGVDTAIVVDYKGLNVPQVTDLRRQLRGAQREYKVVKNTIARRASKGTQARVARGELRRHDGDRLHRRRRGGAGEGADRVHEGRADAQDQGGGRPGPGDQAGGGHRPRQPAGQAGAVREAALRAAGADAADRLRCWPQRRAT